MLGALSIILTSIYAKVYLYAIGLYYRLWGQDKSVELPKYNPGILLNASDDIVNVTGRRRLVLIRHAQSSWNEIFNDSAWYNFGVRLFIGLICEALFFLTDDSFFFDASLSDHGTVQAQRLHKHIQKSLSKSDKSSRGDGKKESKEDKIKKKVLRMLSAKGTKENVTIVSSPMRRCIETAALGLFTKIDAYPNKLEPVTKGGPLDMRESTPGGTSASAAAAASSSEEDEDEQESKRSESAKTNGDPSSKLEPKRPWVYLHASLQELTCNVDGISLSVNGSLPVLSSTFDLLQNHLGTAEHTRRGELYLKQALNQATIKGVQTVNDLSGQVNRVTKDFNRKARPMINQHLLNADGVDALGNVVTNAVSASTNAAKTMMGNALESAKQDERIQKGVKMVSDVVNQNVNEQTVDKVAGTVVTAAFVGGQIAANMADTGMKTVKSVASTVSKTNAARSMKKGLQDLADKANIPEVPKIPKMRVPTQVKAGKKQWKLRREEIQNLRKYNDYSSISDWKKWIETRFSCQTLNGYGYKPFENDGTSRIKSFVRWLFLDPHPVFRDSGESSEEDDIVVIVGHSTWLQNLFKMYLPKDSRHVARSHKMGNCAVVTCELVQFSIESSSAYANGKTEKDMYCIPPDSIVPVYGNFSKRLKRY